MTEFVTLHDGREVDLNKPNLMGVKLETVATMLYRQLRYNGATSRPYCVLEHTVRGVRACLDPEQSVGLGAYAARTARYFFLHDLHEIVTGDMASPVIRAIGKARVDALKERCDAAVYERFGVEPPDNHIRECVVVIDQCMFQREWIDLMPTPFDQAAPGGHDGPTRDFCLMNGVHPAQIDRHFRPGPQHLIGEFCDMWRRVMP